MIDDKIYNYCISTKNKAHKTTKLLCKSPEIKGIADF